MLSSTSPWSWRFYHNTAWRHIPRRTRLQTSIPWGPQISQSKLKAIW